MKNKSEVTNAINYWLGVECLTPSSAPRKGCDDPSWTITWDVDSNHQLPWNDPHKLRQMAEFAEGKCSNRKYAGSKSPSQWSYIAFLSLFDTAEVFSELRDLFKVEENEHIEFRKADPAASMALTLDSCGFVTGNFFVSSVPWAMGVMRSTPKEKDFDFSEFEQVTRLYVNQLEEFCGESLNIAAKEDTASPPRPIQMDDVAQLCDLVYARAKWRPKAAIAQMRIQARLSRKSAAEKDKDVNLLNSFYVPDLIHVSEEVGNGKVGAAFAEFMTGGDPVKRIDVRKDKGAVDEAVMPRNFPLGRWPSLHRLVLAQQFAVNTIMNNLGDGRGLFSVNGPPGTGKTTLLRDIVAGVVVERAIKLATYPKAEDAFVRKLSVDGWTPKYTAYGLDEKLGGSGIVVASANNGAVENVTKELPGMDAVPSSCTLRYFQEVSDSVFSEEKATARQKNATWGMIAAPLGNKKNINVFSDRFGPLKPWESKEESPDGFVSLWDGIAALEEEKSQDAWEMAKANFNDAHRRALAARERLERIARSILAIANDENELTEVETGLAKATMDAEALKVECLSLEDAAAFASQILAKATALCTQLASRDSIQKKLDKLGETVRQRLAERPAGVSCKNPEDVEILRREAAEARVSVDLLSGRLRAVQDKRPTLLQRIFKWRALGRWQREVDAAIQLLDEKMAHAEAKSSELRATEIFFSAIAKLRKEMTGPEADLEQLKEALGASAGLSFREGKQQVDAAEDALQRANTILADKKSQHQRAADLRDDLARRHNSLMSSLHENRRFLDTQGIADDTIKKWLMEGKNEEDIQRAAPWHDTEFFKAREALFCAAVKLHQSFVVNSWQKLQATLKALIAMISGDISPNGVKGGAQQLWDALFLVVPVVSTAFASVARMFQGCGCESLGWLLIDEAGQATPQQTLGALWRTKRAVVVGDPLQLEPIVSLPREVLQSLERRCKTQPRFTLIESSAQSVADKANRFGTEIGSLWVGSPLRVHRRCLNPMFKIANSIAYEGMMVHEPSREDESEKWPSESCWIHVPAKDAMRNYIPAQVKRTVELVQALDKAYGLKKGEKFNVYVITPFKDMNDRLKISFGEKDKGMYGTVHTFQGKEADIVIFVLGGDPAKPGVITNFAARNPNLLNVAMTRAKNRIYVIGDHDQWTGHKCFKIMEGGKNLPRKNEAHLEEMIKRLHQRAVMH